MRGTRRKSFESINYSIRPSKQVERKIFVETFHRLVRSGYSISEYTYLGLGSVFYVDFIFFHKYLYIDKMICAEWQEIPHRMEFNKPFRFIKLHMKPVSDLLPALDRKEKYLVWLDYDCGLNADVLADVDGFAGILSASSILMVTVEAEPRLPDSEEDEGLSREDRQARLAKFCKTQFEGILHGQFKRSWLARNEFPKFLAHVLREQVRKSLSRRPDLKFFQMFNFVYSDGTQMLTLGGMIERGTKEVRQNIMKSGVYDLGFTTKGPKPKTISVPPLTVREKQWLDQQLRAKMHVRELDLPFELQPRLVANYLKYYRHYPSFHEILL